MFTDTLSATIQGINALIVHVETDIANGLPTFNIVGSAGTEVKEARDRVRSALKNNGINIPPSRVTINLSPGGLRKDSTAFDLPICIGMLTAMEYLPEESTEGILFLGEIGLNGEIRPVRGVLPVVMAAKTEGVKECIVPTDNASEGSIVPGITVRGASDLKSVVEYLINKDDSLLPATHTDPEGLFNENAGVIPDFDEVRGQERAKRAAVISAAGFHSLLMTGPPGAGKSMIARRIPGILPPLTLPESLELTSIYSVAGKMPKGKALICTRSFQSPHHTITGQALVGGGPIPMPGIISLSHRSVLFLDELPEFGRDAIECLRQPLEEKSIRVSRIRYTVEYPADFLLISAMNPCPCGYFPDRNRCRCSENEINRYLGKISGPILDRIDLCTELKSVEIKDMTSEKIGLKTSDMAEMVLKAREMQERRYKGTKYRFNSELKADDMDEVCRLGKKESELMEKLYKQFSLSARSYHRILRVSRTIADIEGSEEICTKHLLEAASFRPDLDYFRNRK
ncbi:MAG: YifB family Mg chelatase-like AAA ATPase [Lachnospiraceae bacterium]|nr:YifB family Mg chelatase-like AAA ATPase [Lachnospiraceae bacterium]